MKVGDLVKHTDLIRFPYGIGIVVYICGNSLGVKWADLSYGDHYNYNLERVIDESR